MSSKCRYVDNVKKRRDGPARESLSSTIRESLWEGMADCLLSTSPSALSVCLDLAREKADRKAARAEVAYGRLPRRKPRKWRERWVSGSPGRGYLQDGQLNRYH